MSQQFHKSSCLNSLRCQATNQYAGWSEAKAGDPEDFSSAPPFWVSAAHCWVYGYQVALGHYGHWALLKTRIGRKIGDAHYIQMFELSHIQRKLPGTSEHTAAGQYW